MKKMEKITETNAIITDSLIKSLICDIRMQAKAAANAQYEHWMTGSYPPVDEGEKWYHAFVTTMATLGQLGIYTEWEIGIVPGGIRVPTSFTVAGYTPPRIVENIARDYPDMTFIDHDAQDNSILSEPARATKSAVSARPTPEDVEEQEMLTIAFNPAHGVRIVKARRLTEAEGANRADKGWGLVAIGEATPLPHLGWADLPHRASNGAFQGHANCAWCITDEEAAAYKQLEAQRAQDDK